MLGLAELVDCRWCPRHAAMLEDNPRLSSDAVNTLLASAVLARDHFRRRCGFRPGQAIPADVMMARVGSILDAVGPPCCYVGSDELVWIFACALGWS